MVRMDWTVIKHYVLFRVRISDIHVNMARAKRRWRKWDRYTYQSFLLSTETVCSKGAIKSYNQRAAWINRKNHKKELGS